VVTRKAPLIAAIAAIGLSIGIVGCSSTSDSPDPDAPIVVGMNSGLLPQFQEYVDVYNATADVKVELAPIPDSPADYIQQLVTQSLSGDLPDVVFNYDSLNQQLAASDLLFDLGPWLEEGKDGLKGSDFVPAFLDQYADQSTGAIGGLPVSADSTMLFYNKTLFEKAGVSDLPSDEWTWEDLYVAAEKISAAGNGEYWGLETPIGVGDANFVNYPFLHAGGSAIFDQSSGQFAFADEKGLAVWELMLQPYTEGWGTPHASGTAVDYFAAGQAAMRLDTRPAIARYRDGVTDDWDVANLPTLEGNATVGGGSYALSISAKSNNKENAWKFLSWFYSTDGGMKEAEPNGVIPATLDGIENGSWKEDDSAVPANLIPATTYAVQNAALPPAVPDEAAADLGATLKTALEEVLAGKSIEDAYTEAQDKLNALLK